MRERLLAGKSPRQIAEEMCDRCLAPDTSGCGKVKCTAPVHLTLGTACCKALIVQLDQATLADWQLAGLLEPYSHCSAIVSHYIVSSTCYCCKQIFFYLTRLPRHARTLVPGPPFCCVSLSLARVC